MTHLRERPALTLPLLWAPSKATGTLQPDEVHVWAWALEPLPDNLDGHVALLDDAERQRMNRFHFAPDRARYAVAHGNVRRILGAYLHRPPAHLTFQEDAYGKPRLAARGPEEPLAFSISHSRRVAALAVSRDGPVGVDVEDVRPIERAVAAAHFSAAELADLDRLDAKQWPGGFYRCWTRKEAILKAEGIGLNRALDGFDVSLLPGSAPALLGARIPFRYPWKLYDVDPAENTLGALAIPGSHKRVSCFSFQA
jgi:4'-phosphopantetheinyl transferase